uniref:Formyl transferase N-terminal domain-containing protein n=1 Tax=Aegilops tauschii subsp. strangulata TaxID=200361 RepID=A0A453JAG4_AEGTS
GRLPVDIHCVIRCMNHTYIILSSGFVTFCLSEYAVPGVYMLFVFLYSNHDRPVDNHVMRFLKRHEIPYHYLPTTSGNKREQEILELIEGTDFVVLARYMQ